MEKNGKDKSSYRIKTVSHAIDLLEQFNDGIVELGVTELSERLSLHKNNIFRLLATLESREYIRQNPATGNYQLGVKNLQLGQTMIRQMGLSRKARPVLESLAAMSRETVDLAVLKGSYVVCVDVVESDLPVRACPRLGSWLPAHCTAAGKAQLAFLPGDQLAALFPGELQRCTAKSVTELTTLQRQLSLIAENGYAIEDEEVDVEVRSVSAPVCDFTGKVVGAVGISGPVTRLTTERIAKELVPLVKNGAAEVSRQLGFQLAGGEVVHAKSHLSLS